MDTTAPKPGTSFEEEEKETHAARASGDESLRHVLDKACSLQASMQIYLTDIRNQWATLKDIMKQLGKCNDEIYHELEDFNMILSIIRTWSNKVGKLFKLLEQKDEKDVRTLINVNATQAGLADIENDMIARRNEASFSWTFNDCRYQKLKELIQQTEQTPVLQHRNPGFTKEHDDDSDSWKEHLQKRSYNEGREDESRFSKEQEHGSSYRKEHEDGLSYSIEHEDEPSYNKEPEDGQSCTEKHEEEPTYVEEQSEEEEEAEAYDKNPVARQLLSKTAVPTEDYGQQPQDPGEHIEESVQTADCDREEDERKSAGGAGPWQPIYPLLPKLTVAERIESLIFSHSKLAGTKGDDDEYEATEECPSLNNPQNIFENFNFITGIKSRQEDVAKFDIPTCKDLSDLLNREETVVETVSDTYRMIKELRKNMQTVHDRITSNQLGVQQTLQEMRNTTSLIEGHVISTSKRLLKAVDDENQQQQQMLQAELDGLEAQLKKTKESCAEGDSILRENTVCLPLLEAIIKDFGKEWQYRTEEEEESENRRNRGKGPRPQDGCQEDTSRGHRHRRFCRGSKKKRVGRRRPSKRSCSPVPTV